MLNIRIVALALALLPTLVLAQTPTPAPPLEDRVKALEDKVNPPQPALPKPPADAVHHTQTMHSGYSKALKDKQ